MNLKQSKQELQNTVLLSLVITQNGFGTSASVSQRQGMSQLLLERLLAQAIYTLGQHYGSEVGATYAKTAPLNGSKPNSNIQPSTSSRNHKKKQSTSVRGTKKSR